MSCFATVQTFPSAQSGFGQPPDRAQICPSVDVARVDLVFSEPVSGPPKVNLRHRNTKKSVKNVDRTRTEASNCAKHGPGSNYSPVETTFRKRVVVVADTVNIEGHKAL